jgi:hypothetical protein
MQKKIEEVMKLLLPKHKPKLKSMRDDRRRPCANNKKRPQSKKRKREPMIKKESNSRLKTKKDNV